MLKELYQQVVNDAQQSVTPKLIDLPGGEVLLYAPGHETRTLLKDRKLHADKVSSTESMLDWCGRYEEAELVVKVSDEMVKVYANRDDVHDTDTLEFHLTLTRAMVDLLNWIERPRSQQQVVAALRTSLAGTFDDKLLPIFRRLDFTRKNDGTKSISHTGESLGKSVEAKAQTASGEIPEILVFSTEVYNNIISPSILLRFALDVDATQELIKIAPVGDCLADAYRCCTRNIVADLKAELPTALVISCQ